MEEQKKKRRLSKDTLRKLIVLGALLFVLFLCLILRICGDFAEYYSRFFVKFYSFIFGNIASFFPFSLFELFLIATIAYVIIWIVFFIIKTKKTGIKKSFHMIMRLGIVFLSILTIYQATAGFEYARFDVDIPQHTQLIDNPKDYREITFHFLDDFNYCASQLEFNEQGSVIAPYKDDQLISNIEYEYSKMNSDFYYEYTPKAKPMYLTSWAYRMLSITGVSFAPTGEPNYNVLCPDGFKPFTIAHEVAHSKGAMPEEDANLTAAYICINSEDPYIRYSGYNVAFWSMSSLVLATNEKDDIVDFYNRIDSKIYANNSYENKYWADHAVFDKISDWLNDLYLKMNNDNGTVSYTDNVDVVHIDTEYVVKSYSRYQALLLWFYFDKN